MKKRNLQIFEKPNQDCLTHGQVNLMIIIITQVQFSEILILFSYVKFVIWGKM